MSGGSKPPVHGPLSHQTSSAKHNYKHKTIKNFKTATQNIKPQVRGPSECGARDTGPAPKPTQKLSRPRLLVFQKVLHAKAAILPLGPLPCFVGNIPFSLPWMTGVGRDLPSSPTCWFAG